MPTYQVDVVASYEPTEPMVPPEYPLLTAGPALKVPNHVDRALSAWGMAAVNDGTSPVVRVNMAEDASVLPARLTLTVSYAVDAPTSGTPGPTRGRSSTRPVGSTDCQRPRP